MSLSSGSTPSNQFRPLHKEPKLGRTIGMVAVGAWAPRIEIAKLLQEGISGEELIQLVKDGEEGAEPFTQSLDLPGLAAVEGPFSFNSTPTASAPPATQGGLAARKGARHPETGSGNSYSEPVAKPRPAEFHDGAPPWARASKFTTTFSKEAKRPQSYEAKREHLTPTRPASSEDGGESAGKPPAGEPSGIFQAISMPIRASGRGQSRVHLLRIIGPGHHPPFNVDDH